MPSKRLKLHRPMLAHRASRLIPSVFRSGEKRKTNTSYRKLGREFLSGTNHTDDRFSHLYMNFIPSSIVKKYLKKGAASSNLSTQATFQQSTTMRESRLGTSTTSHNLQELFGPCNGPVDDASRIHESKITYEVYELLDPCNGRSVRKSRRFENKHELKSIRRRLWDDDDSSGMSSLETIHFEEEVTAAWGRSDTSSLETIHFEEEVAVAWGLELEEPYPLVRARKLEKPP